MFRAPNPGRTARLILANTAAPGSSPFPGLSLLVRVLVVLPETVVRWATWWNWRRWFLVPTAQQRFWLGLLKEVLQTQLRKADLLSGLRGVQDFVSHHRFDSHDLDHWRGQVLIIESTHDEAFPAAAREALRRLYPHAQVKTFAGTGMPCL